MSTLHGSSPHTHSSPSPTSPSSNGVPSVPPSNSQIEAVIQMATSAAPAADSRLLGRDTRTQLFVGNLPYRVRWQDLKDLFRKAGTVLRADVSLGPDNRSRGYGTVLLATSEDAARAVDMFNGYNWQTRTLEVRPDRLPPDFDNAGSLMVNPGALPPTGGLSGQSFPIPIPTIPFANSLGDGGMSVSGPDDFEVAKMIGERARAGSGAGSRSLFVGNLPFHCQWQDLKDLFRQAGTIVRADVALGPDGRSRGFGTVSFASDADADRALTIFNGYEYNGRALKVHYDKYSQGQLSQSPIPHSSIPVSSPPQSHHAHPNAPSHISLPMPPPLAAFEQFVSGHQSTSPYEHPFGQISPYDIFPPHIAASVGNAAAQAYMNNRPRSPVALASDAKPTWSPLLAPADSTQSLQDTTKSTAENPDPPATATASSSSKSFSSSHPPAHPGPIALPSPPIHPFPHVGGPISPLQGLPPITPSMPTFTFVPQNVTPPLNAHFLSPGIGLTRFSPTGTMSPGSFYHPASNQRHPMGHVWNVAPGAPVQMHSPMGSPGSPSYYAVHAQQHHPSGTAAAAAAEGYGGGGGGGSPHASVGLGMGLGVCDYFSVPTAPMMAEGYFPPVAGLRSSGLANEIVQDGSGEGGVAFSEVREKEQRNGDGDESKGRTMTGTVMDGGAFVSSGSGGRENGVGSGSGGSKSCETSWEEVRYEDDVVMTRALQGVECLSLAPPPVKRGDAGGRVGRGVHSYPGYDPASGGGGVGGSGGANVSASASGPGPASVSAPGPASASAPAPAPLPAPAPAPAPALALAPVAPHRTHLASDDINHGKPPALGISNGDMGAWPGVAAISGGMVRERSRSRDRDLLLGGGISSERRASWTPDATRVEFRRGLVVEQCRDGS